MSVLPPSRVALSDAAERLGVHYMTAYRYVRTGRLPAERENRLWTVALDDLRTFSSSGHRNVRSGATTMRRIRLRDRMTKGDEAGAWSVIEEAMASGSEPTSIYSELLMPALRAIGKEWKIGNVSIAQEHRASEVATRLVGRLGPRFARRGPSRGVVVIGMVPGDQHGLPAAILADFFRVDGLEPINLGPNAPSASFLEMARDNDRVRAVLVGATTAENEAALREVVSALKRAALQIPVLAGGRSIRDEAHARSVGADGWSGREASDAVARVNSLLAVP